MNTSKGLRRIIMGGLIFSLAVTFALFLQIILGGPQVPNRIGIVTSETVCSEIGADMVRMGGNSIDAYIASSLCLSVVNPFAAGLGAGGFILVRDHKHDRNYGYNCFFKSSSSSKPPDNDPNKGIKSIAVPGELKCLQTVYHLFARFYWKTLSAPAINLARNGFTISKNLAEQLQLLEKNDFERNPQLADLFLHPNGTLKQEGDLAKNAFLANTLDLLNKHEYVFYHQNGQIGNDLVDELTENGEKQLTHDDLNEYEVVDKDLEMTHFDDFIMLTNSFPSAGPVIKFIIDLIKTFPTSVTEFKTPEFYERLLEASKLGYNLASYVSDSVDSQTQQEFYESKLKLAKDYLKNINSSSSEYPFEPRNVKLKDDFYTNFISVNDHNDYMVSYVGTLGSIWGSRVMSKNGYFLNNGISLFSFGKEANYNQAEANKQPRGLMTPILTYNQKNPCIRRFSLSYSHKGANMEDDFSFSELAQVITKILTDFSLYETALSDKRLQFSPDLEDNYVCYENGFDSNIRSSIENNTDFKTSNSCMFHSIDLVMKKDHIVYGQADLTRSQDSLVVFN